MALCFLILTMSHSLQHGHTAMGSRQCSINGLLLEEQMHVHYIAGTDIQHLSGEPHKRRRGGIGQQWRNLSVLHEALFTAT
ncbi:hypothetical protein XENTR_v10013982 [Xenopus tropicalis]|nr:hypothetical protein XENTR_v10013982 [Xenopus tropicalis]